MPEWDEYGKLIEDAPAVAPKKSPVDIFRNQLATAGSFGHTPQPEEMPEGALGKLGMAGSIASLPLGVQAVGSPLAALKGLALSMAGASAGGYAGRGLGQGLEYVGAPEGTSRVAGTIGGLAGGLAGPIKGPAGLLKLAELGGGRSGMLASLARKALPEAAEGAAGAAAARAETVAAKMAAEEARAAEIHAAKMETAKLRNEILKQRLEGKVPARMPKAKPASSAAPPTEGATALEPEFIDPSAVKVLPFPPAKGTVKPATNLGGAAKPGPAGTPPDQLEETLRRSIEAVKAKKAGAGFVADEAGKPITLYHGTNKDFSVFETTKAGKQAGAIGDMPGAYFTPDKSAAEGIARFSSRLEGGTPTVKTVQVRLKNPAEWGKFKTREAAEAAGHDGVIFRDMDGKIKEVVAFHPEQIVPVKAGAVRGKSPVVDKALDTAEGMHQREATAGMTERVAARRKEVGADKLARELGMDADVIRSDAGDVVGEALGAHSPIIPEKAWKEISAKMLSLPPSERYAYVARATGWARPQIEQLRRTYENLGIAIPVAATGAALASDR